MMGSVADIRWADPADALPAFLTIAMMPLTFSIAHGLVAGMVAWVVLRLATGRRREVHPAFAVTTLKPLTTPALAKLPTLDSQGMKGFNVSIWHGLYAPKGTPKAVLDQMNTALRNALKDADFIKRQEALGAVVITDNRVNPAEHKKFVEAEISKWGPAIKAAGQYAD